MICSSRLRNFLTFSSTMSMFIGGQSGFQTVDPEKVKIATVQFEAQSITFNRILTKCHEKCITPEFGEGDLNSGEQSCIDRCVSKFFKANQIVGKNLQYNRQFNINKMPEFEKVQLIIHKNDL